MKNPGLISVKDSEDDDYQSVVDLPPPKRVKLQQAEIKEEVADDETDSETESESDYTDSDETDSETL